MENLKINVDAQLCNPTTPTIGNFRAWLKRNFSQIEELDMITAFDELKDTVRWLDKCSMNGEKEIHRGQSGESGTILHITENGFQFVEWCHNDLSRYAFRFEFSGEMYYAACMVGA